MMMRLDPGKSAQHSLLMTQGTLAMLLLALLILDWTALHDIAKGELSPYAEVAALLISVGFAVAVVVTRKKGNNAMRSVRKASS